MAAWFCVAAAPVSAYVAVTGLGGGGVDIDASDVPGNDSITVTGPVAGTIRVTSPGELQAAARCVQITTNIVDCPIDDNASLLVNLRFGLDIIDASALTRPISIFLPDGGDTVTTGPAADGITVNGSGTTVSAGGGADGLSGGEGTTVLRGQGGDDTLDGHGELEGGDGDDTLSASSVSCVSASGGDGTDSMTFTQGNGMQISLDGVANDGFIGAAPSCNVAADVEILRGGYLDDMLAGGAGPQRLEGLGGNDQLVGLDGEDTLIGESGDDQLDGGGGNDLLDEGAGNGFDDADVLIGGLGHDAVDYSARIVALRVDNDAVADDGAFVEHDDVRPDIEELRGGSGADALTGGPGNERLIGGPGNDVLVGAAGADVLLGGAGDGDVVDYSARGAAVSVDLDGAIGDDGAPGEQDTAGADVESAVGGSGNDTLQGNASNDALDGGVGDDALDGHGGNDVLVGAAGADVLTGGDGTDVADYSARLTDVELSADGLADDGIAGEGDNIMADVESLTGGAGDDVLIGSAGSGALRGGGGADILDGGLGADRLEGGAGDDGVYYDERTAPVRVSFDGLANDGGEADGAPLARDLVANDVEGATGGAGADVFVGDARDNAFDGGAGADLFTGGGGDDLVYYGDRNLAVTVSIDGAPDDGNGDDGPPGARDNVAVDIEELVGGHGDDALTGGEGDDYLDGLDGGDRLVGLGGLDHAVGGVGDDTLDSRDGVGGDANDCGAGTDTAFNDAGDIERDCEIVNPRPPAPPTTPSGQAQQPSAPIAAVAGPPRLRLRGATPQRLRRRAVRIRIGADTATRVTASATLTIKGSARTYRLPPAKAHIAPGADRTLLVRLSAKAYAAARRALARRRTAFVRVAVRADGTSEVKRLTIRLRR